MTRGAGRWRRIALPAVAALPVLAVLLALGAWQLSRKDWKEGLIAQMQARAFGEPGEPVPEAGWSAWRASHDEFRRVRIAGEFLHDREVAVHGLAAVQPGRPLQGFYIFTPLRRADGSTVLVNRGFVPTPLREKATRTAGLPAGPTIVTGLVRAPESRGWFVPGNEPDREAWFVRDLGEMARARGLGRVAPYYLDADAVPNEGGWPRGGQTRLILPNNHLQYAVTWFGLAGTLLAVFAVFARRRWRESTGELQPQDPGHDQPDAGETRGRGRLAEQP